MMPDRMQAIVSSRYGSPDGLKLEEVKIPTPGVNEVLIRVHAASVNDWDWGLVRGEITNRILNGLLRPKKVTIFGCDVAGTIVAVGKEVTRFKPGDDVYGDLCTSGFGAFAEYVCARESALASMPARMTFTEAAAIPQAALLALQALQDKSELKSGQQLLINGAGGGVGTFALQLARAANVEITGVDSAGKLALMRSLGFDHVMDYGHVDFTKTGQRWDLILDAKTNRSPFAYARALKRGGVYVTVGGSLWRMLQILLFNKLIAWVSDRHIRILALKPNKGLEAISELFEAGDLIPVIDRSYSLSEVPAALRYFSTGAHKGKIVITIP